MKTIFTYLILASFILGASGKVVVYLNFYLNQEYIAENFCENRAEPVLECNGKCQLVKELAKEEKKEKKEDKQQFQDNIVYFLSSFEEPFTSDFTPFEEKENFFNTIEQKTSEYSNTVFHPPTFS